jgi:hypothetical protein
MNATGTAALAAARVASCPDAKTLARLTPGRRLSVLEDQAQAWRTLGLSVPVELTEALAQNRPAVDHARERMAAGHRRVFPNGCTSIACRYGC